VLANAIITLEGSNHAEEGSGFELVVVLDSEGKAVSRHSCRENHVTMMRTHILPNNEEVCDSKQLLEASSVPFIISNHQSSLQTSRKLTRHVHPASPQRQYVDATGKGERWPTSRYQPLWFAAVDYCRKINCDVLVTLVSSSFIPRDTISLLAGVSFSLGSAVIPMMDPNSIADDDDEQAGYLHHHHHHERPFLTIGAHPLETSYHVSDELKEQVFAFTDHPLNYERVSRAIRSASKGGGGGGDGGQPRLISSASDLHGYISAMSLCVAMPINLWEQIESLGSYKGLVLLEDSTVVGKVVSMNNAYVHYGAYIVVRHPFRAMSLLSNNVSSVSSIKSVSSHHPHQHSQQQTSTQSKTLFAVTCAGIWHRTLSMLLSLEVGEAKIHEQTWTPTSTTSFDFLLAVTPRDEDSSFEFVKSAGMNALLQPRPIGLTNLWNLVTNTHVSLSLSLTLSLLCIHSQLRMLSV
jgi:hypothetical protein